MFNLTPKSKSTIEFFSSFLSADLWWGIDEFFPKATIGGKEISAPDFLIKNSISKANSFSVIPSFTLPSMRLNVLSPSLHAFSMAVISLESFIILRLSILKCFNALKQLDSFCNGRCLLFLHRVFPPEVLELFPKKVSWISQ